ncbi:amino acid adenylation domain-containing protein [Ancylobacter sp. 3268]|uniref:amino acid adenylation domain-containing protein n=1 Tax=Ancylobacter sp. 3268 TaxID=2817752 RepID=UPI002862B1CE|nr:amino acid adenylation domain-containing protein [Ancylobacter sp. 3268]MDR6955762.1 amino acid adenylation domain-containing protein [Ancylobacter sp. 3268]
MSVFNREFTVHGVFRRQASASPSAVAIGEADTTYSYENLESRSNRLARYLEARHVQAGDRVALLTERSADTIATMLAILKTGAAFVPLDPAYPVSRLAGMLRDAAPVLVIGRASLAHDIADAAGDGFIDQAVALAAAELFSAEPLSERADAGDPAYVMYTSGSTGRPKGVVVPHRAVVRLVRGQSYARFAPDEVMLHLAPLAFDASTFEIWGALLNGARLAVVPGAQPSLDDIVGAISAYGATTAWFTAGLFHLLVDQRLEGLRPLRQILTGGDVVSPIHVRRARQVLADCRFINGYGPTENTTFSCCHLIERDELGPLPIGRPIAHSTAYVLDDELRPLPEGEKGQLCVGGEGLALGYLNAPEMTEEKFRFVPSVGERLYLTGDVVRRRPDGVYEFFGRADQQVKIDGKRIEIEEIETALRNQSDVADVAVVASGDAGAKRLVAFIKPAPQASRETLLGSIGDRLRLTLPAYMVPSGFRVVETLPLTANGKIDRTQLTNMPEDAASTATAMPRTALEAAVAQIWGEVLNLRHVPRDVSFFELGGTSLRLMNVHARLPSLGRAPLLLVELFDHPTVASLAARLEAGPVLDVRLEVEAAARAGSRQAALRRIREGRLGRAS